MFKDQAEALVMGKKVQQMKLHMMVNKKLYLCGAAGVGIGASLVLIFRKPTNVVIEVHNHA